MNYHKVRQPKLADAILQQLETMILEGSLLPGQKLPPERELAKQFEVSRPSLREAIQKLEAKGLVYRRQGGGTYVHNQLQSALADPLFQLISSKPETQFDLLEFRHALEGISAYYAALRGTEADFKQIQQGFKLTQEKAQSQIVEQVEALYEFYLAIAEASHNLVIVHLVQGMAVLIKKNIAQNIEILSAKPEILPSLDKHRDSLMVAILARDPEAARMASHHHLSFIEESLLQLGQEENRLQRAMRRVQKELKH
ncbi:pyruvate dehydrogenase complex transcriptional repressor PdhR [Catenovulum adriaticum]|uniref:Pyruvate dehydrogenase complex repressor n=1 Tax=Catenovulum adriaticum TaxID=2984846 RepID=A0ABY7AJP8_9ALTE|nr:pyruvate dehydrogenase complex transcriptional repressor PdhR [Catenovulum sp. TS8]WAJ69699.1 pyruvate dehydrogenase complex transcriptional repressor PdhR [Catenovulum sp. TS8]